MFESREVEDDVVEARHVEELDDLELTEVEEGEEITQAAGEVPEDIELLEDEEDDDVIDQLAVSEEINEVFIKSFETDATEKEESDKSVESEDNLEKKTSEKSTESLISP